MKLVVVFNILCAIVASVNSTPHIDSHGVDHHFNNRVCSSKDIRSSVSNFKELRGCRVIEGFLMILLIEKYENSNYEDLSFPELTEITEFFLMFNVIGLKSLGKLFPNLRVIRGNVLVHDSAFVIYEMPHLREIGLKSLVKISRGNVRIQNNPLLCFVDTIDWSLITSEGEVNIILNNKEPNKCPNCLATIDKNNTSISDPSKLHAEKLVCPELNGKKLCWNREQCQTICDAKCGNLTCNAKGQCCDERCLGCTEEDPHVCLSCRHLSIDNGSKHQCVKKCSDGLYAYSNRRCISANECRAIKKPVSLRYDSYLVDLPYIPHDGVCRTDCPSNFQSEGQSGQRICNKCVGRCKQSCPALSIVSISVAQLYHGCTHIDGSFVIKIPSGPNIERELETFFSDIEVIDGALLIIGSHSISSLGFFRKLHTIKGTGKTKFSLVVKDNKNLESLFPQNVTVERGRIFFYNNPKLCTSVVKEFKNNVTDLRNESQLQINEVSPYSNGDKTACNVIELDVQIKNTSDNSIVLQLESLANSNEQQLIGYLLYYMPAPFQNVTLYDGRDVCGNNNWKIEDISNNIPNAKSFSIHLTGLKPDTQYAYFVQTYTVGDEYQNGQSPIKYFRTQPSNPNSKIIQKCPANMYSHENRECLTAEECHAVKKPPFLEYLLDLPYIPHDGVCRIDCPTYFYADGPSGQRVCTKCVGSYKKDCPSGTIRSMSHAQRYKGCTHINGSLTISIRNSGGFNVVRGLESLLSDIEVIEGPLSIIDSYSILSLGFFKNLHTIKGDVTRQKEYGLKVMDNENLEALFTQNVTVEHGSIFFHFNPKLCMNTIKDFKNNVTELRNVSKLIMDEVAPYSNGDKTSCNVTELEVNITKVSHNDVIMKLTMLSYEDERQLLGYLLYYKPAPFQNVTIYDGRDACGCNSWQIKHISTKNRDSTQITVFVTSLQPYTQYAYFIRTYTVVGEHLGGLSPVKYVQTEPHKPDPVKNLSVISHSSSEIEINWEPPIHANGILTKYVIKCVIIPDNPQLLGQRNYCEEPLGTLENKRLVPVVVKPNQIKPLSKEDDSNCNIMDDKINEITLSDEDIEQLNEFENELHNIVYIHSPSGKSDDRDQSAQKHPSEDEYSNIYKTPYRKSTNTSSSNNDTFPLLFPDKTEPAAKTPIEDKMPKWDPTNSYYTYVYGEVNASVFTVILEKLKHYSYYSIAVKACREGNDSFTCGNETSVYQRTEKIEQADNIKNLRVEKLPTSNDSSEVRLSWDEPENPNGMIVSYNIQYQRVDIKSAKSQEVCISRNLYHNQSKSYTFLDLASGNYSFAIRANSLAGPSNFWSPLVYAEVDERGLSLGMMALILLLILVSVCGIVALAWYYRRYYGMPESRIKIFASFDPEYISMQNMSDE